MTIVDTIRLSQQAKEQLIKVKRYTGIEHWNVLCRWSLCLSLREPSQPPPIKFNTYSNVEMTWKVFGGHHHEIYEALLKERCLADGLGTDDETLAQQFRLHLHRGIAYLAGHRTLKTIRHLITLVPQIEQELAGSSIRSHQKGEARATPAS